MGNNFNAEVIREIPQTMFQPARAGHSEWERYHCWMQGIVERRAFQGQGPLVYLESAGKAVSREAAAEAARRHRHTIDAGVIDAITEVFYYIPNAALFASVSLSLWRRWSIRWVVLAIAAMWLIGPLVWASVG